MKLLSFFVLGLLITLSSISGFAQNKKSEIRNKEFQWTITIPKGFDTVPADQWEAMQNKGADAIEDTYGEKVENQSKTIFAFRSDQFNYFESSYQPFDVSKDGDYIESFKNVNALLYGTFEAQMPDAKLDSTSSTEVINGLTFQVFKVAITFPNNMVMDFWMYSRLFENKELTVNIITVDKQQQKALLEAWRNSKFGKK